MGAIVLAGAAAAGAATAPVRTLTTARVALTATARSLTVSRSVLFGVSAPGAGTSQGVSAVARSAGKSPGLINVYVSFASPNFDRATADGIHAQAAVPMLTWEPWADGRLGPNQPAYALRRIVAGAFDGYIRHWARGARAWNRPLLLRFAPEMNGSWNSWSVGVNGNTAREYVEAWRHVHALFDQVGATNVEWVWSPNISFAGSTPLRLLYPGDRFVDWLGVDGYNWGLVRPGSRWRGAAQVFGPTLASLRRLARKPILLTEVATTEVGGSKSRWISGFFSLLRRNHDVLGFVWFDFDKETDWRFNSSEAARAAFVRGVSASRYRGGAVTQP